MKTIPISEFEHFKRFFETKNGTFQKLEPVRKNQCQEVAVFLSIFFTVRIYMLLLSARCKKNTEGCFAYDLVKRICLHSKLTYP